MKDQHRILKQFHYDSAKNKSFTIYITHHDAQTGSRFQTRPLPRSAAANPSWGHAAPGRFPQKSVIPWEFSTYKHPETKPYKHPDLGPKPPYKHPEYVHVVKIT